MSETEFDIIFRGDIVMGHQLAEVKLRLQQLFKTDAARIDALFSGRPVPLKRNLDEASAQRYREVLTQAGALVQVVASGSVNTAPKLVRAPERSAAPTTSTSAAAAQTVPARADSAEASTPGISWSLAPAGSDLLGPGQRAEPMPVQVDISGLSLRPQAGNLVDTAELEKAPEAAIEVPAFTLAEVGGDLLRADEKAELPLLEIELEAWGIAPAGSDLLRAEERTSVEPVRVDTSQLQIAPAGSDLGQLKAQRVPLNPDTSALKLVDEDH